MYSGSDLATWIWDGIKWIPGIFRGLTRPEWLRTWLSFWVGAGVFLGIREYNIRYGVNIVYESPTMAYTAEARDKTLLKVVVHQYVTSPSCFGAKTVYMMVKYLSPKGEHGPIETAWIREHDPPSFKPGQQDITMDLHLVGPLDPGIWHFNWIRWNNCGILDELFPRAPVTSPRIDVRIPVE